MEMGRGDSRRGFVGDQKILEGAVEARLVTRCRSKRPLIYDVAEHLVVAVVYEGGAEKVYVEFFAVRAS